MVQIEFMLPGSCIESLPWCLSQMEYDLRVESWNKFSSSSYFWSRCLITGLETIRLPPIDTYACSGNYHTNLCLQKFDNFKPTYDWDHAIFGICTVSLNIMSFRLCHIIPNNRIYHFLKQGSVLFYVHITFFFVYFIYIEGPWFVDISAIVKNLK